MKKNLLFILSIFVFSISFVACSDDDDDVFENGSTSTSLNIDGISVSTSSFLSNISYSTPNLTGSASLNISIWLGDDNGNNEDVEYGIFTISILKISLEDIQVGDNLANNKNYDVKLLYQKENYWLNNLFVPNEEKYDKYKGQAIVTEFDKSSQIMKVEFKNIILPLNRNWYPDYNYLMKVNGHIKCKIEMD
ncbi:hypothetical protein [Dysgonomonas sp. 511]|uniref:hypothetical protein n=1 Tax=Dysgonomonas sp. 511 TaxID=2302930 RepID=UPI0013D5F913|nr:hypothetical protein [Dysgonomonas sp. 511]NDV78611.1 hypothetical protein [Dysgonomonas sp. 511]